jgi:hypothetical protein
MVVAERKRALMERWFDQYIKTYLANPGQNDALRYGVEIVHSAAPQWGEVYFKVIGVHHLTGSENGGQHNVFCEVLDEEGKRIQGAVLIAANINNTVSHVRADKPDSEPAASIPMWGNDTLTVSVAGNTPSEKVRGLHTRHADEGSGNTLGHHSFLVVWQKRHVGHTPTPQPEPEPDPQPQPDWLDEIEQRVEDLRELIREIRTNT